MRCRYIDPGDAGPHHAQQHGMAAERAREWIASWPQCPASPLAASLALHVAAVGTRLAEAPDHSLLPLGPHPVRITAGAVTSARRWRASRRSA